MTSSAQGQHWEDKIMQPLKTRQSAIDQHFKRSIKLKSGDFVQIIPTEIMKDAPLQLSCAFPGCSKKCANRGALANHVTFAHTARGWTQFPDMWSLSQKNLASLFNLWLSLRWPCMWYPVLLGWLLCHSSIPYFDLFLHLSAPKTKGFQNRCKHPKMKAFQNPTECSKVFECGRSFGRQIYGAEEAREKSFCSMV